MAGLSTFNKPTDNNNPYLHEDGGGVPVALEVLLVAVGGQREVSPEAVRGAVVRVDVDVDVRPVLGRHVLVAVTTREGDWSALGGRVVMGMGMILAVVVVII